MSASLVGSEMCIRDRHIGAAPRLALSPARPPRICTRAKRNAVQPLDDRPTASALYAIVASLLRGSRFLSTLDGWPLCPRSSHS
eukprot:11431160-Alexandrium_andersonii.AAC.1